MLNDVKSVSDNCIILLSMQGDMFYSLGRLGPSDPTKWAGLCVDKEQGGRVLV